VDHLQNPADVEGCCRNVTAHTCAGLKLAFPWFYGYNILRGLWVLTRLGYRDERMEDALAVLREKKTPEGKWVLESTPYGRMQANLEKKGQPSKWITLKALWVLEKYGRA